MKYPKLVPPSLCKTPVKILLNSEEITNTGEPETTTVIQTKCNWQDGAHKVMTDEQMIIETSGRALFDGDIAPNLSTIGNGYVEIFGEKRRIAQGRKNRNPDGTVNYCTLEVI